MILDMVGDIVVEKVVATKFSDNILSMFYRCVYCFADRPSDPYARFCHACGKTVPPIPQTRVPPPEPGQVRTKIL